MKTSKTLHLGILHSIFTNRYLFSVCAVFMLSAAIAFFVESAVKIIFISAAAAVAVSLLVWYIVKRAKRRTAPFLALALACLLACTLALSESFLYFDVDYAKYSSLDSQSEVEISGTVKRRRYSSSNISSFEIQLDSIDGDENYGDTYAILDCMYIGDLQVGDRFTALAVPTPLSDYSSSVYDEKELIAQNFSIAFTSYSEGSLDIFERLDSIRVKLLVWRTALTQRLCINDEESGGIAAALLLGDKSMLPSTVRRDFSRSGVSHILALSGLHVTVLFGILDAFLRLLLIPKKIRIPIISFAALFYLALIGFMPSAVRAVIMLFFTYAAFALSEDGDPVTSLGVAGALIIAFSPTSVADGGFWMSFFATLGIVCTSPWISAKLDKLFIKSKRRQKTVWRRLAKRMLIFITQLFSGIAIGIAACTFTLWVLAIGGGSISLLSPIVTLILTPVAGFMLVSSLLYLIFYSTPLGAVLFSGVQLSAGLMTNTTERISQSSDHIISLCQPYILPICAAMLLLAILPLPVLRRGKGRKVGNLRTVIVPLAGIVILSIALTVSAHLERNDLDLTYITPSTESEFVILQNKKDAVICDISNGGSSSLTRALRVAEENGAVNIAAIMLTDYHSATPGSLYKAFSSNSVKRLWLPEPQNTDDYYTMLSCIEKAELAQPSVEVYVYRHGETLTVFESAELCLERTHIDRSVRPILLLTAQTENYKLAYLSPTYVECDDAFKSTVKSKLEDTNALIFGRNGPIIKQRFEAKEFLPCEIIFASENVGVFADLPKDSDIPTMTVGEWRTKAKLAD